MDSSSVKVEKIFPIEGSWEICNKVGGIHTVISSKLQEVMKNFKDRYLLIGPWLEHNTNFIESKVPLLDPLIPILKSHNIPHRYGYWDIEGLEEKPPVILVGFVNRYKTDELLYNLWNRFGIDSLSSNYDYIEPILFATAAAECIQALADHALSKKYSVVAHFHEWLCGAGILYLKEHAPYLSTVFTTHATVLGRALSGDRRSLFNLPKNFDPSAEARKYNIFPKHSLEKASTLADCFTTVSKLTADEASLMLNKYPDIIVHNGLNIELLQQAQAARNSRKIREKLLTIASQVINQPIPKDALILVTSGRFEFHNKGYDSLLYALAKLKRRLTPESRTVVVFFLIAAQQYSQQDALSFNGLHPNESPDLVEMTTHKINDAANDLIIRTCTELQLRSPDSQIRVIYSNAYLDGADGVFNMPYEHILGAADLSVFPSLYEPWGYTPLESIVFGTPTITTNLSGFGDWIMQSQQDSQDSAYWTMQSHQEDQDAVYVLDAKDRNPDQISDELCNRIEIVLKQSPEVAQQIRTKAQTLASTADWKIFFKGYIEAYQKAIGFNAMSREKEYEETTVTSIQSPEDTHPRFRLLQHEGRLPDALSPMREFAYNLWWTWNENSKNLFQEIDSNLWETTRHNPVAFLNRLSSEQLEQFAHNSQYLEKFNHTLSTFQRYMESTEIPACCQDTGIDEMHPLAYFCMEYGIDPCLPVYSGGLGILAGDYLKTLSDIHIPSVAVGLFYHQGYFRQIINLAGEQIEVYDTTLTNEVPMKELSDPSGKTLLVNIETGGRTIYCRVWEVKVGRLSLYLLDADIPENNEYDRTITQRLYEGDREIRLLQEIVLGVGGFRLLEEKLSLTPAIYHLNEGHSAFLLLARIKQLYHDGYSLEEAIELTRASSLFTTHTPVPAGTDTFSEDLMKKYFTAYALSMGTSIEKLLSFGRDYEQNLPIFSMTMLAFRLTGLANSVAKLHKEVSRRMWHPVWPSFLDTESPIENVTNGVHLNTWIGPQLRELFNQNFLTSWRVQPEDPKIWESLNKISDQQLWLAHQIQKERLLDLLRKRIITEYATRNEHRRFIDASVGCLRNDVLLIGLARRITGYKRNDLILRDKETLSQVLTHPDKPVVLVIAGKAHPLDTGGKELIHHILETSKEKVFNGHIIFLENYDISLAKALVQGVDVWLNTPILYKEACGTSGMKAAMNGVLNLSTLDGWWNEGYNTHNGFAVQSFPKVTDLPRRNDLENMDLLHTLEARVAPLYYDNKHLGYSPGWVEKMRAAIGSVAVQFNTQRMAQDYFKLLYHPLLQRNTLLQQDQGQELKKLVAWKQTILERFNTVKIKNIIITGLKEGKVIQPGEIKVKLMLVAGKLDASELKTEFILVKSDGHDFIEPPQILPLQLTEQRDSSILTYELSYQLKDTGFYAYGFRVYPHHPLLLRNTEAGIVYWG